MTINIEQKLNNNQEYKIIFDGIKSKSNGNEGN